MLTGTTTGEKEQPTVEEELMNQPMGEDERVKGTNGGRGNGISQPTELGGTANVGIEL